MTSRTKNLFDIRQEVERLAAKIETEPWMLPTFGYSEQTGRPHIEEDGTLYYFVQSERGGEFVRWKSDSLDELLFVIFRSVVSAFDLKDPTKLKARGKDQRRDRFQQNVELMTVLSETWAQRLTEFQRRLVELFPFDDCTDNRFDLAGSLQAQGISREEASRLANDKYPAPERGTLSDGANLYEEFHLPHT